MLKFQEFECDAGGTAFHFEGPRDFLVGFEFVNGSIEPKLATSWIGGLKFETAVTPAVQLQHFCSHPLFENVRLDVRAEHEFHRQVEVARYEKLLLACFGVDLGLQLH